MFLRSLLNAGILAGDAEILEQHYANEPEFLDGLEQIARALTMQVAPGLLPPDGEPWKSIHMEMLGNPVGATLEDALDRAIQALPAAVQMAVLGAVQQRMHDLQQWLQVAQNQGKKRKTAEYIKALANLGFAFRYNQCTHNIEVNSTPMSDPLQAEIRGRLRDHGIPEINIAEDAYLAEAWRNRYHPIRDYLTSLQYQGTKEIERLASFFIDEDDVFGTWLRRWLIGACARVMANEQNRMLVLDGRQDMGKDYFARWLASSLPEYYNEGPIMPDEKDHRLRLLSAWIWDVNELGSTTRRSDREALKAFITLHTVRERRPYGHYDIQGPAITSFIGTVNNEGGILNDPTGSRRYMIAKLKSIDWQYTQIKVDDVWAEAFEAYLHGETHRLTGAELEKSNQINDSYQMLDPVEETIKKLYEIDPGNTALWLSSLEILETLKDPLAGNLRPGTEIDPRRLASALTKLGLEKAIQRKISGVPVRGYFGIQRRMP